MICLKFESAFARRIGQCFHFAVVKKPPRSKTTFLIFFALRAFRDQFADLLGGGDVRLCSTCRRETPSRSC